MQQCVACKKLMDEPNNPEPHRALLAFGLSMSTLDGIAQNYVCGTCQTKFRRTARPSGTVQWMKLQ